MFWNNCIFFTSSFSAIKSGWSSSFVVTSLTALVTASSLISTWQIYLHRLTILLISSSFLCSFAVFCSGSPSMIILFCLSLSSLSCFLFLLLLPQFYFLMFHHIIPLFSFLFAFFSISFIFFCSSSIVFCFALLWTFDSVDFICWLILIMYSLQSWFCFLSGLFSLVFLCIWLPISLVCRFLVPVYKCDILKFLVCCYYWCNLFPEICPSLPVPHLEKCPLHHFYILFLTEFHDFSRIFDLSRYIWMINMYF